MLNFCSKTIMFSAPLLTCAIHYLFAMQDLFNIFSPVFLSSSTRELFPGHLGQNQSRLLRRKTQVDPAWAPRITSDCSSQVVCWRISAADTSYSAEQQKRAKSHPLLTQRELGQTFGQSQVTHLHRAGTAPNSCLKLPIATKQFSAC